MPETSEIFLVPWLLWWLLLFAINSHCALAAGASEPAHWAGALGKGEVRIAWGVCLHNAPSIRLMTSVKLISKCLWLAVQAMWVIVPSDVHAGSGSDLRRLFQPSIIKVFKNKLWLSAAVQGEGMVNAPFPAGSTAESQQIQLFPHSQKDVKKNM